jgi:hypothetical protein
MIKKSFLTVLLVAAAILAFSTVQAQAAFSTQTQAGAMTTNNGPVLPNTQNVYVNPGGMGDALIYGYYNARGSWNFIRVINTSNTYGVAAKVRFREGRNSNEVLDFYVCLSRGDQWSAWLLDDGNSAHPAQLYWYDKDTPTYPDPNGNDDATDNLLKSVSLRYAATGAPSSVTADDTKEGYFEIIGNNAWDDTVSANHVVTPIECGQVALNNTERPKLTSVEGTWARPSVTDVPNTLAGNVQIYDIADAAGAYALNATALANFMDTAVDGSLGVDSTPQLKDATDGLAGVDYALTKAREYATYDIETGLEGQTTLVNTFPTKRLNIIASQGTTASADDYCKTQNKVTTTSPTVNGPFNDAACVDSTGAIANAVARCEDVGIVVWDDAENNPSGGKCDFSPCSVPTVTYQKCDEVSLLTVGTGANALLNSTLVQKASDGTVGINTANFEIGWLTEDFTGSGRTVTLGTNNVTTHGLPVISYELQGFVNGYYTNMLPLRSETDVTGPVN